VSQTVKLSTLKTTAWGVVEAKAAIETLPAMDDPNIHPSPFVPLSEEQKWLVTELIVEAEGDDEFTILDK
jgi:hypothetical protein